MIPLALALALLATPAAAAEPISGPFEARYVSCFDGDTCRFDVTVWIDHTIHTAVRLRGIDAPEIRSACPAERERAIAARAFLRELLEGASAIVLFDIEPDKYGGRVVADIMADGRFPALLLREAGLARLYDGGAREGWCGEVNDG